MDPLATEDRRLHLRSDIPACLWVEVPLALSYETVSSDGAEFSQWQWDELAVSPDLVKAMVDEKDLTIRDPLLLQMVTRIDWMLTSIFRTLGKDKSRSLAVPELTTVNLSGSGMKFFSVESLFVDSFLVLRMILKPFIPIQAVGRIIRIASQHQNGEKGFEVAVEFTRISPDDREAIIRHILRAQATLQRLRLHNSAESASG